MAITTKGKYQIAIEDQGFILQGTPDRPSYVSAQAPVYGTRFASGDRDYNDLSQWWYMIQTDWSGGTKDTLSFEDDARFFYSSNIDVRTQPGAMRLEREITQVYDGTTDTAEEILHAELVVVGGNDHLLYITNNNDVVDDDGDAVFTSMGSPQEVFAWKTNYWMIGSTNKYGSGSFPIAGTSFTTQINGIIDGSVSTIGKHVIVGNTLYLFGISDTDNIFCVKTTVTAPAAGGDWTLIFETSIRNNLGASIAGAAQIGGEILVLIEGSPVWSLFSLDIASGILSFLKDFPGDQAGIYIKGSRYVTRMNSGELVLTIMEDTNNSLDDKGSIWKYDGTTLTKIWSTDEVKYGFAPTSYEGTAILRGGGVLHHDKIFWGNLVYDGTQFYNFIKDVTNDETLVAIPIGTDGQFLYMVDTDMPGSDDQIKVYAYDQLAVGFFKSEGFLVFNQHDKLQSIDKLLHSVNIGFDQLVTGQEIEVYYSELPYPTPDIADWTLLGEATYTTDGGVVTGKTFGFADGVDPKKVWFRVNLKGGGGGSTTPSLTDFTLEYLPIPDYRRQWVLNINSQDDMFVLDGTPEIRTGREIAGFLEKMWLSKEIIEYQDINYAKTLLNGALNNSATTVTVDNTADFPESGRIVVNNEEIFYTGKTATTFTGCTRGKQSTIAVAHSDNAVVYTGLYKAIITNFEQRIPILQKDKYLESVIQLQLRETGVV